MGILGADDGEGGTLAERIALIGILCFAFAWVPIFIVWKMLSAFRARNRSPEQEVEAGNMPVTTNPAKPDRDSMQPGKPPAPSHRGSMREVGPGLDPVGRDGLPRITGLREPGRTVRAGVQKECRGKRKPMPTRPAEPMMRMLPDTEAIIHDTLKDPDNTTRGFNSKETGSRLPGEMTMHFPSPWGQADSEHSSGHPDPSVRTETNHKQQRKQEQAWPLPLGVGPKQSGQSYPA